VSVVAVVVGGGGNGGGRASHSMDPRTFCMIDILAPAALCVEAGRQAKRGG